MESWVIGGGNFLIWMDYGGDERFRWRNLYIPFSSRWETDGELATAASGSPSVPLGFSILSTSRKRSALPTRGF